MRANRPPTHVVLLLSSLGDSERTKKNFIQIMVRRRGFSRGLAAVAAATLCLTFYPQTAVARESIWSEPDPRKTLEAPRSGESIRKRLAAGIGMTSIEQDAPGIAASQDSGIESQDGAATGTCKRREGWRDDGFTLGAGDVCHVGEDESGPDTHKDAHQGGDRESTGQKLVGAAEEGRPLVTDDDSSGLSHRSIERNAGKGPRGFPARDSIAYTHISNEFQPVPEHDPWEGYQIIAQADPVASWEVLRQVCDSRTLECNGINAA